MLFIDQELWLIEARARQRSNTQVQNNAVLDCSEDSWRLDKSWITRHLLKHISPFVSCVCVSLWFSSLSLSALEWEPLFAVFPLSHSVMLPSLSDHTLCLEHVSFPLMGLWDVEQSTAGNKLFPTEFARLSKTESTLYAVRVCILNASLHCHFCKSSQEKKCFNVFFSVCINKNVQIFGLKKIVTFGVRENSQVLLVCRTRIYCCTVATHTMSFCEWGLSLLCKIHVNRCRFICFFIMQINSSLGTFKMHLLCSFDPKWSKSIKIRETPNSFLRWRALIHFTFANVVMLSWVNLFQTIPSHLFFLFLERINLNN